MAYKGATPWHGLGNTVAPGASIETWLEQSGLTWSVHKAPVQYQNGIMHTMEDRFALYRNDTGHAFDIVSDRYKVVQPTEIVEFFRNIATDYGFEIETVGALGHGEKVWALAKTPNNFTLRGGDTVNDYLLLSTSYDRSMPTQAFFTSVRVVCNNTLQQSLNGTKQAAVTVSHRSKFDSHKVQDELGVHNTAWHEFGDIAKALSERKVSRNETVDVLFDLLKEEKELDANDWSTRKKNIANDIMASVRNSPGAGLASADGTAWGLLNGITHYTDHKAGSHNASNRLNSAWFGSNATLKAKAFGLVRSLVDSTPIPLETVTVDSIFANL
jgi:phage/plasmid-like protein (TIGR03299 family)